MEFNNCMVKLVSNLVSLCNTCLTYQKVISNVYQDIMELDIQFDCFVSWKDLCPGPHNRSYLPFFFSTQKVLCLVPDRIWN